MPWCGKKTIGPTLTFPENVNYYHIIITKSNVSTLQIMNESSKHICKPKTHYCIRNTKYWFQSNMEHNTSNDPNGTTYISSKMKIQALCLKLKYFFLKRLKEKYQKFKHYCTCTNFSTRAINILLFSWDLHIQWNFFFTFWFSTVS